MGRGHRQIAAQLKGHGNDVEAVAFAPDGKTLATASWDNSVMLWDVASGRIKGRQGSPNRGFVSLAFAPDGKTLAVAGGHYQNALPGQLRLLDAANAQTTRVFEGHATVIRGVCFAPDGKTLASVSDDGIVKLWSLASPWRTDAVPATKGP